jgi:hypothetical protein
VEHPLSAWQQMQLDEERSSAVACGNAVVLESPGLDSGLLLRTYNHQGRFLAILKFSAESGLWRPEKVFNL